MLRKKLYLLSSLIVLASMILAACGSAEIPTPITVISTVNPNEISTMVAETVEVVLSQTPTEMPEPEYIMSCPPVDWDQEIISCDSSIAVLGQNDKGEAVIAQISVWREEDFLYIKSKVEVTNAADNLPRFTSCWIDNDTGSDWGTSDGSEKFNVADKESVRIKCDLRAIGQQFITGTIKVPQPTSELAANLTASPTPIPTITPTPTATSTPTAP